MTKRKISLENARALGVGYLVANGMPDDHAGIVTDHLIYATLAGHDFAGFSRLLPIAGMLRERGPGGTITTVRETAQSAAIDGANVNGYVTSLLAMDKAISLARSGGIGVVGLNNSWFSGMLRYYVERAAHVGLVGMHAANSTARVAPYGGIDRLLGTNPIAFAFPTEAEPLVIDFSSASLMWGDVIYHQQTNRPLPEGRAVDADGAPTVDPAAALAGAIRTWGDQRGSALSIIVQVLGILGGSDPIVGDAGKWGYFFLVVDPSLLLPIGDFRRKVSQMARSIESSRPIPGSQGVRMPGSSASQRVAEGRARDWFELDEEIFRALGGGEKR